VSLLDKKEKVQHKRLTRNTYQCTWFWKRTTTTQSTPKWPNYLL